MRRYDVVIGILLILSIIDFALAAPVLVQEKRQSSVDVVHIPKDVVAVLGKRGDEVLEKLLEDLFKTWEKPPVEASPVHASSSSAAPGPDHWSTNVVQAPAPNPASSTPNPDPLMEPSGPSSTAPKQGDDEFGGILHSLTTKYGPDHELMEALAQRPNPNKRPLTNPPPEFNWNFWTNLEDPQPLGPAPPKRPKYVYEMQQPTPAPSDPEHSNPWLADEYYETWKWPILDSSDLRVSSKPVPSKPGSSNPGPSNQEPSNPGPSNQEPSNQEPSNQEPSNPRYSKPRLPDDYFETWKPTILDSSDVHVSSISAPPKPDHGLTNVVQAPGPNPASANPFPTVPSSTPLMQGNDELHERLQTLLTNPDRAEFDWNYGTHLEDPPPPGLPPPKRQNPGPSTDSHFDWDYLEDPRPPKPTLPNEIGHAHEKQVERAQKDGRRHQQL